MKSILLLPLLLVSVGCSQSTESSTSEPITKMTQTSDAPIERQANTLAMVKGQTGDAAPSHGQPTEPEMTQQSLFKGELTSLATDKGLKVLLTVSNPHQYGVPIQYRSGMTADLWVINAKGKRLWAWSNEMMFTQALRDVIIAPNQQVKASFIIPAADLATFPEDAKLVARYAGVATESSQVVLADIIAPLPR